MGIIQFEHFLTLEGKFQFLSAEGCKDERFNDMLSNAISRSVLKHLRLSRTGNSKEMINLICNSFTSIETVTLEYICYLEDTRSPKESFKKILNQCLVNSKVKYLRILNSYIGDSGANIISKQLSKSQLVSFALRNNQIHKKGYEILLSLNTNIYGKHIAINSTINPITTRYQGFGLPFSVY
jgi:hypothetical protein